MKRLVPTATALVLALALFLGAAQPPSTEGPDLPSPLDLRSAIGYALNHNYMILQSRETIRQQDGVVVQVRAQEIPNVSGQGQYQRNEPAISQSYPQANSLWSVELKATQNLFAGGGIASSIKNAKLARDAAAY